MLTTRQPGLFTLLIFCIMTMPVVLNCASQNRSFALDEMLLLRGRGSRPRTEGGSSSSSIAQVLVTVDRPPDGDGSNGFFAAQEGEDIANSILSAWQVLMTIPHRDISSSRTTLHLLRAASLLRPETPPAPATTTTTTPTTTTTTNGAAGSAASYHPAFSLEEEEEEDEDYDEDDSPPPLITTMSSAEEEGRRRAQPPQRVTMIVYIYWRGVQSWDNESVTRGNWPSEMVSWQIKGVEYELMEREPGGVGTATTFKMLPEQVQ